MHIVSFGLKMSGQLSSDEDMGEVVLSNSCFTSLVSVFQLPGQKIYISLLFNTVVAVIMLLLIV